MKKIMIALAVAAMAVASQAAQMKWGSGTTYVPGKDTTKLSGTYGGTTMFISLTAAEYGTLESAIAEKSLSTANDISKYLYDTYKGATATKTGSFMNGVSTITEAATYGAGDTAYGVIIYTSYDNTGKSGDLYYIANYGSMHFDADSTSSLGNMALNLNGTGAAMSWQVAPEPTSAMLLLLGMASLALRRRRA